MENENPYEDANRLRKVLKLAEALDRELLVKTDAFKASYVLFLFRQTTDWWYALAERAKATPPSQLTVIEVVTHALNRLDDDEKRKFFKAMARKVKRTRKRR